MKATYSFLLVLLIATLCRAQMNEANWDFVLVTPTQVEQQLLNSMFEKYQHNSNPNEFIFLCWRPIEEDLGTVFISSENPKRIEQPELNIVEKDETYHYLEARQKLLGEIVQYHESIKKAELELELLIKERDLINQRLNYLKSLLPKNNKVRINRLE